MQARDIMNTPVIAVSPRATLVETAELLHAQGFTTLPVVNEGGRLVGIVSESDIAMARVTRESREVPTQDGVLIGVIPYTVGAIMTKAPLTLPPGTELPDLAGAMSGCTCAGFRSWTTPTWSAW
ncbi:MAG: CBS domain-containing protein [Pseudonocardiaceae bacterium]|nr:CBS domain-containing protein [Pseudonocardiaceae bacterium]